MKKLGTAILIISALAFSACSNQDQNTTGSESYIVQESTFESRAEESMESVESKLEKKVESKVESKKESKPVIKEKEKEPASKPVESTQSTEQDASYSATREKKQTSVINSTISDPNATKVDENTYENKDEDISYKVDKGKVSRVSKNIDRSYELTMKNDKFYLQNQAKDLMSSDVSLVESISATKEVYSSKAAGKKYVVEYISDKNDDIITRIVVSSQ